MNRYKYSLAVIFFVSFSVLHGVEVFFIPGFLEGGPQQAADRAHNVLLGKGGSIKRNEPHAEVMPANSSVRCATMSEFQQPCQSRPLYIRTLATVMAVFMNQFWPWWTKRMGRTYTTTGEPYPNVIDLMMTDIGGEQDLQATHTVLDSMCTSSNSVVFGVSRGAVTTFVALAHRASEGKVLPKVAILESPYGAFSDVRPSGVGGLLADVVHPPNPEYDAQTYIDHYPHTVPTLFVTSEKDDKVPCDVTEQLAQVLANAGHPNVFLVRLSSSQHKNYTWGNPKDIHTYERAVHAFYKWYNVAYDTSKADGINLEQYRVRSQ